MAYLEYFDDRAIALNAEVMNHPVLMEFMAKHTDPTMKLAEIAAYCEVALDGAYTEEDCNHLADILTRRLIKKRTLLLL